ncbi:cutinase family protein [Mycobacterium sp. AZCC_0083]|uniref:cutinase family protein n=1 Tax=Mycobacterium sp. AZCC_0083 TaxID=2735882 RepID=UPI00161BBCAF|nr:cutinase family protein [Mycobacterium sp. AZCC_0083]MBB5167594.1 cutinase [Mycobacterium sp. AZCC_0083]
MNVLRSRVALLLIGTIGWLARSATAPAIAVILIVSQVVVPDAAAAPCPDVEVVFARGTFEAPGVGVTGQAFIDALRDRLASESVEVYPVNYPASLDFARAADGVADASTKVVTMSSSCPSTKIVLGGYSQGAAVAAYTTTDTVPAEFVLPAGISGPMPADAAKHVAAVVLFGKPSSGFLSMIDRDAPQITIGQRYGTKTIELCVPQDPICSPTGDDQAAHGAYPVNGMTDQAAGFVERALSSRT